MAGRPRVPANPYRGRGVTGRGLKDANALHRLAVAWPKASLEARTLEPDRTSAQGAVEGDDELRAVGQEQGETIALANSERLEPGGEAVSEPVKLRVREQCFDEPAGDDSAEDGRDRLRVARGGVREQPLERDGRVVERMGHAGVVVREPRALGRDPDAHLRLCPLPSASGMRRVVTVGGTRTPFVKSAHAGL